MGFGTRELGILTFGTSDTLGFRTWDTGLLDFEYTGFGNLDWDSELGILTVGTLDTRSFKTWDTRFWDFGLGFGTWKLGILSFGISDWDSGHGLTFGTSDIQALGLGIPGFGTWNTAHWDLGYFGTLDTGAWDLNMRRCEGRELWN